MNSKSSGAVKKRSIAGKKMAISKEELDTSKPKRCRKPVKKMYVPTIEEILYAAHTSKYYAIGMTLMQKEELLDELHQEVVLRSEAPEHSVRELCHRLEQCLRSQLPTVEKAANILIKLMEQDGLTWATMCCLERLMTYFQPLLRSENGRSILQLMNRLLLTALSNYRKIIEALPVPCTMITVLVVHLLDLLSTGTPEDRQQLQQLIRSALSVLALGDFDDQRQKSVAVLLYRAIHFARRHPDVEQSASDLAILADGLLITFFQPKFKDVFALIELPFKQICTTIFATLLPRVPAETALNLLLHLLFRFLSHKWALQLKVEVLNVLRNTAGGMLPLLTHLYCSMRNQDEKLVRRFMTVTSAIFSHLLFQHEESNGADAFRTLQNDVSQMVTAAHWGSLTRSRFLVLQLPMDQQTEANLWTTVIVRHFNREPAEDTFDESVELEDVYNVCWVLKIAALRRWQPPAFVVKYLIETVARCKYHADYERNAHEHEQQLRQLLPNVNQEQAFGMLPVSIARLHWLQLQPSVFKRTYIFRQQLEVMEDRALPPEGDLRPMLREFQADTLYSILSSSRASQRAKFNASMLLARCQLNSRLLTKTVKLLLATQKSKVQQNQTRWPECLRAMYGSLAALDDVPRYLVLEFLAIKLRTKDFEDIDRVLLIDSIASTIGTYPLLAMSDSEVPPDDEAIENSGWLTPEEMKEMKAKQL